MGAIAIEGQRFRMSQIGGSTGSGPEVGRNLRRGDADVEEIFRVTARLWLNVLVVSNGSLPIWPDLKKLRPAPGNTERRDETPGFNQVAAADRVTWFTPPRS
jgi:hypothetical protein